MMVEQRITLQFTTPAFLGDAYQRGSWRTPPFKALLRQWWRVVAAGRCGYDFHRLREEEGRIFGHAWLKDNDKSWSLQSRVRLRLDRWNAGRLESWPVSDPVVHHREVEQTRQQVGAHLYLGYGPLRPEKGKTELGISPAIDAGEQAEMALAYPEPLREDLAAVLQLVAWFGTVGSRSRNGWGSLKLVSDGVKGHEALGRDETVIKKVTRTLEECLQQDWPHALGSDERGLLVWRTRRREASWADVMKTLAEIKIAFRTQFPFDRNRDTAQPVYEHRHLLAYPVTNHGVLEWSERDEKTGKPELTKRGALKQTDRLASQLRFKVLQISGEYVGLVFHLPCALPESLGRKLKNCPSREDQKKVWQKVRSVLDRRPDLERI